MKHPNKFLIVLTFIPMIVVALPVHAELDCEINNTQQGRWEIEDPSYPPTGNFSCIVGRFKYQYWDAHLGIYTYTSDGQPIMFPSCQARITYYIPSQFPPGSASCGVDTDPCGGNKDMDYFPSGENCCVERPGSRWVWGCYPPPQEPPVVIQNLGPTCLIN